MRVAKLARTRDKPVSVICRVLQPERCENSLRGAYGVWSNPRRPEIDEPRPVRLKNISRDERECAGRRAIVRACELEYLGVQF